MWWRFKRAMVIVHTCKPCILGVAFMCWWSCVINVMLLRIGIVHMGKHVTSKCGPLKRKFCLETYWAWLPMRVPWTCLLASKRKSSKGPSRRMAAQVSHWKQGLSFQWCWRAWLVVELPVMVKKHPYIIWFCQRHSRSQYWLQTDE